MEEKDIERLLAGRKIVDACRSVSASYREASTSKVAVVDKYADREEAIKTMNKELGNLGFSSQDDFLKFNNSLVLEEFKEMVDIYFLGCSNCPTKKCVELYGNNACGNQKVVGVDDSMRLFFIRLIKKSVDGKDKNFIDVKVCPDGYGFHWKRNRDERFDLRWS